MLALTLGLLLLAGGAAGRFPLVGNRVNSTVAVVGTMLSLVGLGRLVMQKRASKQEESPSSTDVKSRAA